MLLRAPYAMPRHAYVLPEQFTVYTSANYASACLFTATLDIAICWLRVYAADAIFRCRYIRRRFFAAIDVAVKATEFSPDMPPVLSRPLRRVSTVGEEMAMSHTTSMLMLMLPCACCCYAAAAAAFALRLICHAAYFSVTYTRRDMIRGGAPALPCCCFADVSLLAIPAAMLSAPCAVYFALFRDSIIAAICFFFAMLTFFFFRLPLPRHDVTAIILLRYYFRLIAAYAALILFAITQLIFYAAMHYVYVDAVAAAIADAATMPCRARR